MFQFDFAAETLKMPFDEYSGELRRGFEFGDLENLGQNASIKTLQC